MDGQRTLIEKFLACRRIALVGVSRDPRDFTRSLLKEFRRYDAIPVHPTEREIDGLRTYSSVREISPPPEAALLLVRPDRIPAVLEDCHASGISLVWIFGVTGPKNVAQETLRWCAARKMRVIAGYCPFMFLPGTAWFHRFHGTVAKLVGQYPSA